MLDTFTTAVVDLPSSSRRILSLQLLGQKYHVVGEKPSADFFFVSFSRTWTLERTPRRVGGVGAGSSCSLSSAPTPTKEKVRQSSRSRVGSANVPSSNPNNGSRKRADRGKPEQGCEMKALAGHVSPMTLEEEENVSPAEVLLDKKNNNNEAPVAEPEVVPVATRVTDDPLKLDHVDVVVENAA